MRRTAFLPALFLSSALSAQSTCDSIHVEGVRYDPFGNGLQVLLHNGSSQFLSGPTVDVLDADGFTLGIGSMEFFGVVPGSTNTHQVHFTPQPPSPFTGTIRVNYTDMNGPVSCDLAVSDVELCPADSCLPLGVYAYQQGGAPVATDLDWSVVDAEGIPQASGVLHIDSAGFGYAVAELCLPPGDYTLHMAQAVAAGNLMQIGMTQDDFAWTNGTNTQLPPGGEVVHPFPFFSLCAESTQGFAMPAAEGPAIVQDGRTLRITAGNGKPLGALLLLDGTGRVVRAWTASASNASVDLGDCASGVYILRPLDGDSPWPAQRFILR